QSAPVQAPQPAADLVQIAGARPAVAPDAKAASWAALSSTDQEVHLRAQQYARVFAADLLLRGRAGRPLYDTLKKEIDAGRDAFRREFYAKCPTMVDYLHLELVRTVAAGDPAALGSSYPGPLR
ncbi:MAG TPA: hypothetical protein VES20_24095, partial [Bryobacteraceae bacterium]|nr:hypothetical protein [Bryobacteraceae bacterium]